LAGALEALVLDPVYSGKGLAGLIALVRTGRWQPDDNVVFLHTGGAADNRPLSENEADDRLKAALNALGEARGVTVAADTALTAARRALSLISLGLIAAGVKRELADHKPSCHFDGRARPSAR
jgi:hypothetical protein